MISFFARLQKGEKAYPEFRQKGSKWFRDNTYFFVWTTEGKRVFHAADPSSEGKDVRDLKDVLSKPVGVMMTGAANSPQGEGWVHYMWPEPGDIFPTWKSSFVKKVTFPSGKPYMIGCGIYNMQMDKAFIEDVVNRAADLVSAKGREAFGELRDKKGPFVFMDVYVFVDDPKGVELVNPAQPSIEGKNIMELKDAKGKFLAKEYIDAAMKKDNAWVDYYWYKPGSNVPALKHTLVRKVTHGGETFILGAGFYENGE
jgi:signal transduction histidine kinase